MTRLLATGKIGRLFVIVALLAATLATTPSLVAAQDGAPEPPAREGMVYTESVQGFEATWDAIVGAIDANPNLTTVATVDHAAAADSVGLDLDPNRVVIFGNPMLGTPLMSANQLVGIDLPQRIQVIEVGGQVFVGFNEAAFLADRHGVAGLPQLDVIAGALRGLTAAGTGVDQPMSALGAESFVENDRLMTVTSDADFETTWARLNAAIEASPANVFNTVDHSANAESAGLELPPTRLVLFGNPNIGTPLMVESPTAGLDLPLRILVWEDADGTVMVTANTIDLFVERHGVVETDLTMVNGALNNFLTAASTTPDPVSEPAPTPEVFTDFDAVEFINLEFGTRYLEVQPNVNVYSSNQSNTATEYVLHPVDGADDTYLIQSVSTGLYLHANDAGGHFNVDVVGPVDDTAQWQILPFGDGYHVLNVGLQRLLQADRPGFNVDTDQQSIDERDFGLDVEWNIVEVVDS